MAREWMLKVKRLDVKVQKMRSENEGVGKKEQVERKGKGSSKIKS